MKIFDVDTDRAISVAEFLDAAAATDHAKFSPPHVAEMAVLLKQLANNRDLIWQHLQPRPQERWETTFTGPASFVLGSSDLTTLRANVWLPSKKRGGFRAHEDELYAYNLAHNHDFTFLTVGYHGAGYRTDLFDFFDTRREIPAGESVALTNYRSQQLNQGSVWLYEEFCDVHVQHEPSEPSISINALFKKGPQTRDQLLFDVERSVVIGVPRYGPRNSVPIAIQAAQHYRNALTRARLREIATHSELLRLRSHAAEALRQMPAEEHVA